MRIYKSEQEITPFEKYCLIIGIYIKLKRKFDIVDRTAPYMKN